MYQRLKPLVSLLLFTIFTFVAIQVPVQAGNNRRVNPESKKEKNTGKPEKEEQSPPGKVKGESSTGLTYGFEVVEINLPESMKAGAILNADITLRNSSDTTWESSGSQGVSLAYHWIDKNGQFEVFRSDITSLRKSVKPGEVTINLYK